MLFRKSARVAVLGCGPTGLFAVHAFAKLGFPKITIISRRRRSEMFGAQYLHEPIPGLTDGDGHRISYHLWGTPEEYASKVYGGKVEAALTSPVKLPKSHMAYDIRQAYYKAWGLYADRITNLKVHPSMMSDILRNFDIVVSTIPASQMCADMIGMHQFKSQQVWAVGDAPERGIFCPVNVDPWTVICNGTQERGWYRASNVFGYKTAEWPDGAKPPIENIAAIEKPIGTNCDCWTDNKSFMRAGRYGTWTKGVLSHQAYSEIMEVY